MLSLLMDFKHYRSVIMKRIFYFELPMKAELSVINTFHRKTTLLIRTMPFLTPKAVQQQKELP